MHLNQTTLRPLTYILTSIAFTTITACVKTKTTSDFKKFKLAVESINFIEIRKNVSQSDSLENQTKRLTNEHKKLFTDKFNNAKSIGLRKAFPLYIINVHLNDSTKRSFRINGQCIKENNDFCFDLGDSMFIEKIWNELNIDHIKNIRYVFEDYIKYRESTDSQEDKNLMTKSLKSLTMVTDKDDLDLLLNVWMYYDPTDYPNIPEIYRILKDSRPHSIKAVKNRIDHKKEWETDNSSTFMELKKILKRLENE